MSIDERLTRSDPAALVTSWSLDAIAPVRLQPLPYAQWIDDDRSPNQ